MPLPPKSSRGNILTRKIHEYRMGRSSEQERERMISFNGRLATARIYEQNCQKRASIHNVPHYLRDLSDDKAYIPQVVSFGPYHRDMPRLKQMEQHKWRALRHTLERTEKEIKRYLDPMEELEHTARSCYEEPLNLSSKKFVQMMLLDGCFILEVLRGATESDGFRKLGYDKNDPIFSLEGPINFIQRDMIMLENQIPLSVLATLLSLEHNHPNQMCNAEVVKLAIAFFSPLTETKKQETLTHTALDINEDSTQFSEVAANLHLLDVFRRSALYGGTIGPRNEYVSFYTRINDVVYQKRRPLIPCITELKDAGIKFRERETDRSWVIDFTNGLFYIPKILIHDGTKSLLFNLIAFEQCHLGCDKGITQYVVFLDSMIESAEDVRYLCHQGIIEHSLGSDAEVADLVKRLSQVEVCNINNSYLYQVSKEINDYYRVPHRRWRSQCKKRWRTCRATLWQRYFDSPWAVISFLAAAFLLIMTAAQTFYAVYSYYRPTN